MHKSWTVAPQLTNFDDADVTELEAFRISSKDDYAARGIKLTSMPFLVKAVATALRSHPTLNASIDLEGEQIIYHDYVNLGIAVDTERGWWCQHSQRASTEHPRDRQGGWPTRRGECGAAILQWATRAVPLRSAIWALSAVPTARRSSTCRRSPSCWWAGRAAAGGDERRLDSRAADDATEPLLRPPASRRRAASRFLNEVIALLETPAACYWPSANDSAQIRLSSANRSENPRPLILKWFQYNYSIH